MSDKYLIYSSAITEDIFNQIIEKVESQGFCPDVGGTDNNYYGFGEHGALCLCNEPKQWYTVIRRHPLSSETYMEVSDILNASEATKISPIMINVPKL